MVFLVFVTFWPSFSREQEEQFFSLLGFRAMSYPLERKLGAFNVCILDRGLVLLVVFNGVVLLLMLLYFFSLWGVLTDNKRWEVVFR